MERVQQQFRIIPLLSFGVQRPLFISFKENQPFLTVMHSFIPIRSTFPYRRSIIWHQTLDQLLQNCLIRSTGEVDDLDLVDRETSNLANFDVFKMFLLQYLTYDSYKSYKSKMRFKISSKVVLEHLKIFCFSKTTLMQEYIIVLKTLSHGLDHLIMQCINSIQD